VSLTNDQPGCALCVPLGLEVAWMREAQFETRNRVVLWIHLGYEILAAI
jgi:hypothetical protein